MADEKVILTKEWLVKLEEELVYLKWEKRIEIAGRLKEAISYWDLSENSEYEDARDEQAKVESRIGQLSEILQNAEVVKNEKTEDQVGIWSTVTVELVGGSKKERESYKIVWTTETDVLNNTISNDSPIWKALLGKQKSDKIKFSAPAGSFEYKIVSIK